MSDMPTPPSPRRKEARCSPALQRRPGQSCYDPDALNRLRDKWNERHPDDRIAAADPQEIWQALRQRLGRACKSEACWLRREFAQDLPESVASYTFAPKAPAAWRKKPSTWLTSTEIEEVMNHFEHRHKDFLFLGASPIDFDKRLAHNECVWADLCAFDAIKAERDGHSKIAVIFNLDPHYKGGSHWVALVMTLGKEPHAAYMDSYGEAPPKEVVKFLERVSSQVAATGRRLNAVYVPTRHQRGGSECGMYSLYFIVSLLTGAHTAASFAKKRIPDNEMRKLRDVYFRPVREKDSMLST
jgi:hypothetical protein